MKLKLADSAEYQLSDEDEIRLDAIDYCLARPGLFDHDEVEGTFGWNKALVDARILDIRRDAERAFEQLKKPVI